MQTKKEHETYERNVERLQGELKNAEITINNLKEQIKTQHYNHDQTTSKLREVQDTVYKLDHVHVPAINSRLDQLVTKEDVIKLKSDYDEKVNSHTHDSD